MGGKGQAIGTGEDATAPRGAMCVMTRSKEVLRRRPAVVPGRFLEVGEEVRGRMRTRTRGLDGLRDRKVAGFDYQV